MLSAAPRFIVDNLKTCCIKLIDTSGFNEIRALAALIKPLRCILRSSFSVTVSVSETA